MCIYDYIHIYLPPAPQSGGRPGEVYSTLINHMANSYVLFLLFDIVAIIRYSSCSGYSLLVLRTITTVTTITTDINYPCYHYYGPPGGAGRRAGPGRLALGSAKLTPTSSSKKEELQHWEELFHTPPPPPP